MSSQRDSHHTLEYIWGTPDVPQDPCLQGVLGPASLRCIVLTTRHWGIGDLTQYPAPSPPPLPTRPSPYNVPIVPSPKPWETGDLPKVTRAPLQSPAQPEHFL